MCDVQHLVAIRRAPPVLEVHVVKALRMAGIAVGPVLLRGTAEAAWLQSVSLRLLQIRVIGLGGPILGRRGQHVLDLYSGNIVYEVESRCGLWQMGMRIHWPTAKSVDGAGENTAFLSAFRRQGCDGAVGCGVGGAIAWDMPMETYALWVLHVVAELVCVFVQASGTLWMRALGTRASWPGMWRPIFSSTAWCALGCASSGWWGWGVESEGQLWCSFHAHVDTRRCMNSCWAGLRTRSWRMCYGSVPTSWSAGCWTRGCHVLTALSGRQQWR